MRRGLEDGKQLLLRGPLAGVIVPAKVEQETLQESTLRGGSTKRSWGRTIERFFGV
jgi:hypothetical protein